MKMGLTKIQSKKVWIGVVIFLLLFLIGLSVDLLNPKKDSTPTGSEYNNVSKHETTSNEITDVKPEGTPRMHAYEALDFFIENYNSVATYPIKDIAEHNIFLSGFYRSEYQLDSFKNAIAYRGMIGSNTIEIVNKVINDGNEIQYGKGIRVYAFVDTLEEANDVLKAFLKSTYVKITEADIEKMYQDKELVEKEGFNINIYDDIGKKGIVGGWTYQNETIAHPGGYKILIVAKPDEF